MLYKTTIFNMNTGSLYLSIFLFLTMLNISYSDNVKEDAIGNIQENVTCPKYCTCTFDKAFCLTLYSSRQAHSDDNVVIVEIIQVLEYYSRNGSAITNIVINNSPMKEIPTALCKRYKNLQDLNLAGNRLESISTECFRNKIWLRKLSISNNLITKVEASFLYNLRSLVELDLSSNLLEYIPSDTFRNVSKSSLQTIHLQNNKLKSIGVWPFSQSVRTKDLVVDVRNNEIDKIINDEGFYTNCSTLQDAQLTFYLEGNKIYHLADIFGVFFKSMTELHCLFLSSYWRLLSIIPNELYCDCIDYKFYQYMKFWAMDETELSKIQCKDKYRKAIMVDLKEMICSVNEFCPSGRYCKNQPSNNTYHVSCPSSGATDLPKLMPPRDNPKSFFMPTRLPDYKLDFSYCNLTDITGRSYFNDTKWLDLSNSNVHHITEDALIAMKNVETIFLNNNQLSTLPQAIQSINMTFEKLHLYGNPLHCNCEDKWLKDWLQANKDRLENPLGILCDSPPNLAGQSILGDIQLCQIPKPLTIPLVVVMPIAGVVLVSLAIVALLFIFRIQLFNKMRIHPFDRDECDGEEMEYDVLITFSYVDQEVAYKLLEFLQQNLYKVCYAPRDFLPGECLLNSIIEAVKRSKRTLCLISDSYITRPYCMYEFERALTRDTELRKKRIIPLLMGDVLNTIKKSLKETANTVQPNNNNTQELENHNERQQLITNDEEILEIDNVAPLENQDVAMNHLLIPDEVNQSVVNQDLENCNRREQLITNHNEILEKDNVASLGYQDFAANPLLISDKIDQSAENVGFNGETGKSNSKGVVVDNGEGFENKEVGTNVAQPNIVEQPTENYHYARESRRQINNDDELLGIDINLDGGANAVQPIMADHVAKNSQTRSRNQITNDDALLDIENADHLGDQNDETLLDVRQEEHYDNPEQHSGAVNTEQFFAAMERAKFPALIDLVKLDCYLKVHKYIEYESKDWESLLLYAMPLNKLPQTNIRPVTPPARNPSGP